MLQTGSYSLVLLVQLILLTFDLLVNSFSELLRAEPVVQLVLFILQDVSIVSSSVLVLLLLLSSYLFQVGMMKLLLLRVRALLLLTLLYLSLSIWLHTWLLKLRWLQSQRFVWTDGLQTLFVFQRTAAVMFYYSYKCTAERLGDPHLYQDSRWLRQMLAQARR